MKRLLTAAAALLCAALPATAQTNAYTPVTATQLKLGGIAISAGVVTMTLVDKNGTATSFLTADGTLNGPQGLTASISAGALAPFSVPDMCTVTAATPNTPLGYLVKVERTNSVSSSSGYSFVIPAGSGAVCGATAFALDHYAPPQAIVTTTGIVSSTTVPAHCTAPSKLYTPTNPVVNYDCVAGVYVAETSSQGAGLPSGTGLVKVSSGTASLATAGSDFVAPAALTAEQTRAQTAETTNSTAIANEQTRAAAAETANATAIANEQTRAQAAETANATAISGEVTARGTAVSGEQSRAQAAESANATAIATEATRATTAEAQAGIKALTAPVIGFIGDSYGNIATVSPTPTYTAGGSNSGTATITALAEQPSVRPGNWTVTMTSATTYTLADPTGALAVNSVSGTTTWSTGTTGNTAPRTLSLNVGSGGATGDTYTVKVPVYRVLGLNGRSPVMWANMALASAFHFGAQCGVSSDTSASMLARFGTGSYGDPLTHPDVHYWIFASPVTNDQAAGLTLTQSVANLKAMIAKVQGMGTVAILASTPVQAGWTSTTNALYSGYRSNILGYNAWAAAYARITPGVYFWAAARAVSNPATGTFYAAGEYGTGSPTFSGDGIHYGYPAGAAASRPLAALLQSLVPQTDNNDGNAMTASTGYFGNPSLQGSSSPSAGAVNTSGAYIASSGVTGTAVANMTSVLVRAGGTVTATKTALSGQYQDQGQQLSIATTSNWDGAVLRFGGDPGNAFGRWDLVWAASTAYNAGEKRLPAGTSASSAFSGLTALYTTAGTSGSSAPAYPAVAGVTATDGTATLTMVPFLGPLSVTAKRSYFLAPGANLYSTANSTVYFAPTAVCQTASTEPTAAYAAATSIGATVTDGTCTMTAVAPPTFSVYAQEDFTLSGMTAGKGVGVTFALTGVDTTGNGIDINGGPVYGPFTDVSGSDSPLSQWFPASGSLRTVPLILQPFRQLRQLYMDTTIVGDGGQSGLLFTAFRPRIQPVVNP